MTLIHVDLRKPAEGGPGPAEGVLEVRPFRRRHVDAPADGATDFVLLPSPFTTTLVDGKADVELPPTRTGQAWLFVERLPGGTSRLVAVPEADSVDYGDLVDVDPQTLTPTPPEPTWSDLEARVAALEADTGGGGDTSGLEASLDDLEARVDRLEVQATSFQGQLDNIAALQATPVGQRGSWRFTPDDQTPALGRFSSEGVSLYFHRQDAEEMDYSHIISRATGIRLQVESDATLWRRYEVSAATQVGDVWRLTVELVEGAGPLPSGHKTSCAVLFTFPVETPVDGAT